MYPLKFLAQSFALNYALTKSLIQVLDGIYRRLSISKARTSLTQLILLLVFLISNCTPGKEYVAISNAYTLDLSDIEQSEFSEVFDSIEYVKLNLPPDRFIGYTDKVIFEHNKIFIFDYAKAKELFVFTETGDFLFSINQPGQGPGEYFAPLDFLVSNETIEVLDVGNKVVVYDLNGRFKRQFRLPYNTDKYHKTGDQEYILYTKEISNVSNGTNAKCTLMAFNLETRKTKCLLEVSENQPLPFFLERNLFHVC